MKAVIIFFAAIFVLSASQPAAVESLPSSGAAGIPADMLADIIVAAENTIRETALVYKSGVNNYDNEEWLRAKQEFDKAAMILLNSGIEDKLPQQIQKEYNRLFSQICRMQIRVRSLIHGFMPELGEEYGSAPSSPLVFNAEVERWLKQYVTTGREYFAMRLRASGKYIEMMKEIFREKGLPTELVYTALVESGFNPYAYSSAHAVGVWQFMSGTGKLYGLDSDHWLDERRDVEKSTRAAAEFMKALYDEFDSWELTLAAYNCGPGRVRNAIRQQGTRNFWDLALPVETQVFVPKIFAAMMVARDPESYGFSWEFKGAHGYEEVVVDDCVDLATVAKCCSVPLSEVSGLNPELTRLCTPAKAGTYTLKIPLGTKETFFLNFNALSDEDKYLSKAEIDRRRGSWIVYKVKKGDYLGGIAKRFGVTISILYSWNPLVKKKKYIHPGDKLRVFRRR